MAGIPSIAASSSRPTQRPVLPLPVMPTQTAWVTKSLESYSSNPGFGLLGGEIVGPSQVEDAQVFQNPRAARA